MVILLCHIKVLFKNKLDSHDREKPVFPAIARPVMDKSPPYPGLLHSLVWQKSKQAAKRAYWAYSISSLVGPLKDLLFSLEKALVWGRMACWEPSMFIKAVQAHDKPSWCIKKGCQMFRAEILASFVTAVFFLCTSFCAAP